MTLDVVSKYNFDMSGKTDNAPQLAQLHADMNALWVAHKPLPRLSFSEGFLSFSTWPNFNFNHLQMMAEGTVYLQHTGVGDAITFDGGSQGIFDLNVHKFIIVPGVNTHNTLVLNSVHHSNIDVRIYGAGAGYNSLSMNWNVCTVVQPTISMLEATIDVQNGFLAQTWSNNCVGVYLGANPTGGPLRTTASTIREPIIEGITTGLAVAEADLCSYYDGTIEGCNTAMHLYGNTRPGSHKFINVEMESNGQDVQGDLGCHNNRLLYCGRPNLKVNLDFFIENNIIHGTDNPLA